MQRNDNGAKSLLFNVLLLLAFLIAIWGALASCAKQANAQVNTDGQPEIQIQYPVYLPLVNGIAPVVSDMTCKVTEMLPDGGWIETCTQPISDNRLLVCTVEYSADWRVVHKQCQILS